jgi:trk system potassium uptake protein
MKASFHKKLAPGQYLVTGFFLIIMAGSLLLSLPFAVHEGVQLTYIDALFTSFSAVCVTGLVTVDVAATYTIFGTTIIALLIMVGGMGFAAVIMSIVLILGWDVGISQRSLLSEAYNLGGLSGTFRVVKTVLLASILFQSIGAIIGFFVFRLNYSTLDAIGHSAFHAISAFNNAGFDLMGNFQSMMGYRYNIFFNILTMFLIIIGGLGFFVISDIIRKRWHWNKLTMHTRIVISMTIFLVVLGTVSMLLMENLDPLSALFQSVTARTAGFNTIDTGALSLASLFFIMLLMFVGASPGSTGGGIKTTTTFAIFLSLFSMIFRRQPAAFKRKIPEESLLKAFQVLMLALLTVTFGILFMAIFEGHRFEFIQLAFEVVSAFATVGLSTGITTELGNSSKILLMLVMFIGRLGPITVATSVKAKESILKHVEERIFIG